MHLNSVLLFKKYASEYFSSSSMVLEIGASAISQYQKEVEKFAKWHTLELVDSRNNIVNQAGHIVAKDPYSYDIPDNTYDIVLSGQVIEHVQKPWKWLIELKRITKHNGHIIIINPVSWPYHEDPVDCWRIYPEGIKSIAEESGLEQVISVYNCLEWEYFDFSLKKRKIPGFSVPGRTMADENGLLFPFVKHKYLFNSLIYKLPIIRRFLSSIETPIDTISILKKND